MWWKIIKSDDEELLILMIYSKKIKKELKDENKKF